jgi:hypothetical protein
MGDKGFTITVVLTIAVCIAANTATFAVVNSVLLRPLPVPEASSILLMANRYPRAGADFGYASASGDYYDRLRDIHVFSEQALFRTSGQTLQMQGTPERVKGMIATPSLFRLLRVSPAYGRAFSDAEGEPGANHKAILSDGLSRQLFGSPEAALGRPGDSPRVSHRAGRPAEDCGTGGMFSMNFRPPDTFRVSPRFPKFLQHECGRTTY